MKHEGSFELKMDNIQSRRGEVDEHVVDRERRRFQISRGKRHVAEEC
jgi:hypothetical protein